VIIGYMFKTDAYCADDIRQMFSAMANAADHEDVEAVLDTAASVLGVNRQDEGSFDWSHFPQPVLASGGTFDRALARCGACGRKISDTL
jgi:hypothetical protein